MHLNGKSQVYRLLNGKSYSPKAPEFTANLVTEAEKAGIRHIVRQSMGDDMEVNVAHLRLHRQAEKSIEESGIPFTLL